MQACLDKPASLDDGCPRRVPVASSDLHRLARQGHESVHEIRISFSPHEGMHATHRCPENKAHMIHAQALAEKLVMRGDHVVIVVLREMSMPSIAGL